MKNFISRNLQALIGKKAKRKILVIESDDWGSIRMPSKKAYDALSSQGIPVDECPYNTFDSIENSNDIEAIVELANKFKDCKGNSLKITANFIMANPDFEKIREDQFNKYHYRDLFHTYQHYQGDINTFNSIKNSIEAKVFHPQLHSREHLQVNHWLDVLRKADKETLSAFNQGVWGHPSNYEKLNGINFSSAFHITTESELNFCKASIEDGAKLFQNTFGFKAETFIAPRFIWPQELETSLYSSGIRALQGKIVQLKPEIGGDRRKLKNQNNWMGKSNSSGLEYLIRNVFFEPTQKLNFNWVQNAFKRIETAFFWGKPAIISMHRLNFMGGFSEENRKRGLERLGELIAAVQKRWPEVEFLSSNELYRLLYGR